MIEKATDKLLEEGYIQEWETMETNNWGILSTIVHEIRYLAQSNPYLPEEVLKQETDDEDDAEAYAKDLLSRVPLAFCYC